MLWQYQIFLVLGDIHFCRKNYWGYITRTSRFIIEITSVLQLSCRLNLRHPEFIAEVKIEQVGDTWNSLLTRRDRGYTFWETDNATKVKTFSFGSSKIIWFLENNQHIFMTIWGISWIFPKWFYIIRNWSDLERIKNFFRHTSYIVDV